MTLGIPQTILLALMAMALGLVLAKHGEPRDGNHNFWIGAAAMAIHFSLLYWGGFFTQ